MDDNTETATGALIILQRSGLSDEKCQVVQAGALELVLIQAGDRYFAMDNLCSHAESWLDMGTVEEQTMEIVCPLHGGAFALATGEPTRSPCTVPIRTYQVDVTEDLITIDLAGHDA